MFFLLLIGAAAIMAIAASESKHGGGGGNEDPSPPGPGESTKGYRLDGNFHGVAFTIVGNVDGVTYDATFVYPTGNGKVYAVTGALDWAHTMAWVRDAITAAQAGDTTPETGGGAAAPIKHVNLKAKIG